MSSSNTTWYHGSPLRLETLRIGSTITQQRRLAEVFSHKPPLVCISDEGEIRHTGTQPGWLYRIAEPVGPEDIRPVPRSTMEPGQEWLTNRELALEFIGPVPVDPDELLSDEEIADLYQRMRGREST